MSGPPLPDYERIDCLTRSVDGALRGAVVRAQADTQRPPGQRVNSGCHALTMPRARCRRWACCGGSPRAVRKRKARSDGGCGTRLVLRVHLRALLTRRAALRCGWLARAGAQGAQYARTVVRRAARAAAQPPQRRRLSRLRRDAAHR
jgi:hypothetical protein